MPWGGSTGVDGGAQTTSTSCSAPGGLDDRGRVAVRAEQRGQPLRLGRGRHGEQLQVRAQRGPDVEAEGEREVGVQVPLVALVEDDGVHPGQLRVGLQPADQQAGGDHLDAGRGAAPAVAADAVADPAADGLAEQRGHPARGGAGGHPAGLGDEDAPRQGAGQGERDERRLPGARRRHEHGGPAGRERVRQRGQGRADREVGPRRPGRWQHGDQSGRRAGSESVDLTAAALGPGMAGHRPTLQDGRLADRLVPG